MIDPAWAAVAVAFIATIAGPWIMARQLAKSQADKEVAANKRADELARRVDDVKVQAQHAANLLASSNAEIATKLAATTKSTDDKLEKIHIQGNSVLTAAKQGELRAVELTLATLRALNLQTPTPEIAAQIEITEADRNRLRIDLDERAAVAKFAAEKHEI